MKTYFNSQSPFQQVILSQIARARVEQAQLDKRLTKLQTRNRGTIQRLRRLYGKNATFSAPEK